MVNSVPTGNPISAPAERISVVIPTYKRAATLPQVLPSYLLPEVGEIIIVDDCSPDDTPAVAQQWMRREPRIRYVRQERNLGVCAARNAGVDQARFGLIFFGEDDAYPLPDALPRMLAAMARTGADIVGLRTIHLMNETAEQALARPVAEHPPVDLPRLRFWYNTGYDGPTPAVHAWMLIRRAVFDQARFDPGFTGSAYREETDFCFSAGAAGFKLHHCGSAIMIHLPRQHGGGCWDRSRWTYERTAIANNRRLLRKHHAYLRQRWGVRRPAWLMQLLFIRERAGRMATFLWARFTQRLGWYARRLRQALGGPPTAA